MSLGKLDTVPGWYVVHTHRGQEDRVAANLANLGVETFNPKLKERRSNQFTGQAVYVVKSLFPNYLFAHFNAGKLLSKICFTRGVHTVVSYGTYPAPVDDEIIYLLKSNVGEDGFFRLGQELKLGDKVTIDQGILKSLTGIFEQELKDSNRVMILLETVNFQCRIMTEREMLGRAV